MSSAFPLMANSGAAAASSTAKSTAHTPAMTTSGANTLRMKVTKLNFYYGKNHALHNVSMDVATNKVTAMIGPSGCGKSTLLRTLNRMHETLRHTRLEGEIALDGVNILTLDVTKLRRMVGMVFQSPIRFPSRSMKTWRTAYGSTAIKGAWTTRWRRACAAPLCGKK